MHNDEPVLKDTLERGRLIEEVGEAIAHCNPPQVFGVHGDWGLGKTSFLHQVQWYLTRDCPQQPESVTEDMKAAEERGEATQKGGVHCERIRTVWFEAWMYQHEAAPVVALLHEMRAQLSWRSRVAGSAPRAAKVAIRGALLSLEELTKQIGFQYSKFREEWESENLAAKLPSHTLREHLCEAIGQLLQEGDNTDERRLVVFIDDIDRCESDAAYRLLEGLKVYLTLDNCVFVLGMNQKAIEEAIAQRMKTGDDDDARLRASAYMEKLCQNVWRLPAIRQPERVLHDLLTKTVDDAEVRDRIRQGMEEAGRQCLPPNPRRLKGLANLIGRLSRLPKGDDSATIQEMQLLVIVAYVYQFHHDLYVRWEADPNLYDIIYEWCREPEGVKEPEERYEFLAPLRRPLKIPGAEGEPGVLNPAEMGSTYPDPTEANVFWMQPLILHIGSGVDPRSFERYFHGVAT